MPDDTPAETSGTSRADDSPQESAPHSDQQIFDIPERRRSWFTQVLTRAAAATTLLFAGDSATARDYATQRQRGEIVPAHPGLFDADPPWAQSTTRSLRLRNGMRLEGTRFLTPLPDGKNLEIFRGVDQHLYRLLAENKVGPYLRAAPRTYERWSHAPRLDDAAVSVGRDGTALVIRLTSGR